MTRREKVLDHAVVGTPDGPKGLCECGCGERAPLAPKNNFSKGWVKGEPMRYVNGHQGRAKRRPGGGRPQTAARSYRDHSRFVDNSPRTLRACLLSFGVEPKKLREALKTRTIEDLHWGAFRASGELRKHCRCETPQEIAAGLFAEGGEGRGEA